MYFLKTLIVLAAAVSMVSATPSMSNRAEAVPDDNCNGKIGDCYSNGCNPSFSYPSNTIGTCTAGRWNGCPCEKCGGKTGKYVGPCDDNGCNGVKGVCTAGNYNGCPCK